jgi:hypothetical protein
MCNSDSTVFRLGNGVERDLALELPGTSVLHEYSGPAGNGT